MFTALIALAALIYPADTPIEPITSDLIQLGIDNGTFNEMCLTYGPALFEMDAALLTTTPEDVLFITDSYAVRSFEQAYDEAARMTLEAEALFLDYLHTCI
ncbi:MAG TPA: hypothetical protein VNJ54_00405 [Plantibacter sp.]|uniref:hypothetical protein n=1 Tax=Plantibacter sp. TaxID=1871045 RepID=UPI002C1BDFCF|nr:hypothetical protein [Plantibacter sp.]